MGGAKVRGIVGREDYLKRLDSLIRPLKSPRSDGGMPQFVHLSGPAGIGKTEILKAGEELCNINGVLHAYITFEELPLLSNPTPYIRGLKILLQKLRRRGVLSMQHLEDAIEDIRRVIQNRDTSGKTESNYDIEKQRRSICVQIWNNLTEIARHKGLVLFLDGMEDVDKAVRVEIENDLLAGFLSAPYALLFSASRATLETTWSPRVQERFEDLAVSSLSADEVDVLLDSPAVRLPDMIERLINCSFIKYVRIFGKGHPYVSKRAKVILGDILTNHDYPPSAEKLSPSDLSKFLRDLCEDYFGYVLRNLKDNKDWIKQTYEKIIPLRRFDEAILQKFLLHFPVESERGDEIRSPAEIVATMSERGLISWNSAGMYELSYFLRFLLLKKYENGDPKDRDYVSQAMFALAQMYKKMLFRGEEVLNRPLMILDYLYYFIKWRLGGGEWGNWLIREAIDELNECLSNSKAIHMLYALRKYLDSDTEFLDDHALHPSIRIELLEKVDESKASKAREVVLDERKDKKALFQEILRGNCILFIGPALTVGPSYLNYYNKIAGELCKVPDEGSKPDKYFDVFQKASSNMDDGIKTTQSIFARKMRDRSYRYFSRENLDAVVSLAFPFVATTALDGRIDEPFKRGKMPVEIYDKLSDLNELNKACITVLKILGSISANESVKLKRKDCIEVLGVLNSDEKKSMFSSLFSMKVPLFIGFDLNDPMLLSLHSHFHSCQPIRRKSYIVLERGQFVRNKGLANEFYELWQSQEDFFEDLKSNWMDYLGTDMRIWNDRDVLCAVQEKKSVAGKHMNGLTLPKGTSVLSDLDLSHCVITYGDLSEVSLSKATLKFAKFSGTILEKADLRKCKAHGAIMNFVNLEHSTLDEGEFVGAQMSFTKMRGASVSDARFSRATLVSSDLSEVEGHQACFDEAVLPGVIFERCKLTAPIFREAMLWKAKFNDSDKLDGADFMMSYLVSAELVGASLKNAKFYYADLSGAEFMGANLEGANFSGAVLEKTNFSDACLHNANFSYADLTGADFSRADLKGANFDSAVLAEAKLRESENIDMAKLYESKWADSDLPDRIKQNLDKHGNVSGKKFSGRFEELSIEIKNPFMKGECVLVVGPGLSMGNDYLTIYNSIKENGVTNKSDSEQNVTSEATSIPCYVNIGRMQLIKSFTEKIDFLEKPDSLYGDLIASLKFSSVVTTAMDGYLKSAFQKLRGVYPFSIGRETLSGHFEKQRKQFVQLCGDVKTEIEDLVLTELELAELVGKLYSDKELFSNRIVGRVCIFIGFNHEDPLLYELHSIARKVNSGNYKSYVAKFDGTDVGLEETGWKDDGIVVLNLSTINLIKCLIFAQFEKKGRNLKNINFEELAELKNDRDKWIEHGVEGRRLNGIVFEKEYDLNKAKMSGCMMIEGVLDHVKLNRASLDGAQLTRAQLKTAELEECSLRGATLSAANASGANLKKADFRNAYLYMFNLEGANIEMANFAESDLMSAKLDGASGVEVDFKGSNFSKASFKKAVLPKARFSEAYSTQAEFQGKETNLEGADFRLASLKNSNFTEVQLRNAKFCDANLSGADFSNADLSGADFSNTDILGAVFKGAILDKDAFIHARNLEKAIL